jgi:DNA-binding MarR family transcriptional regulator
MAPTTVSRTSAEQEVIGGKIGFLVAQVGRAATRRFVAALAPVGLNPRQTALLFELRREGAMSQGALGDVLDIDPSNLVGLLNFLEDEGFAERRRDPADRRRHVVAITKRGLRQLRAVEKAAQAVEEDFFGALNPDEREQLRRLLMRVAGSVDVPTAGDRRARGDS